MSKKQKIISFLSFFLVFFFIASAHLYVFAQNDDSSDYGLNKAATEAYGNNVTSQSIPSVVGKLIGAVLGFVGVLFFILMIYGGYTWMLARGNEQEIEKAKNLIIDAVIGLVIVLAAYVITYFITSSLLTIDSKSK